MIAHHRRYEGGVVIRIDTVSGSVLGAKSARRSGVGFPNIDEVAIGEYSAGIAVYHCSSAITASHFIPYSVVVEELRAIVLRSAIGTLAVVGVYGEVAVEL